MPSERLSVWLTQGQAEGRLRSIDVAFALFIDKHAVDESEYAVIAAALVSAQLGEGDSCLPLARLLDHPSLQDWPDEAVLSDIADWRRALFASRVVGEAGDATPLIIDLDDYLYLHRYWDMEMRLAAQLQQRSMPQEETVSLSALKAGLARYFPMQNEETDWQAVAATIAVLKPFCVISGGPGTGKTRTVARLIALLLEQSGSPLRIALSAPTGKAAARLTESIKQARASLLSIAPDVAQQIPVEAMTLHRLLGVFPGRSRPRYHDTHPLPYDVVLVDEASMVDLPMMARLVTALAPTTRLILIGDKDQLASVEAGAVLGDLCHGHQLGAEVHYSPETASALQQLGFAAEAQRGSPLRDAVALLRKSYRFTADSGVGSLAYAVNKGDVRQAIDVLDNPHVADVVRYNGNPTGLMQTFAEEVARHYQPYLRASDPTEALQCFNAFRVLGAVRQGDWGIEGMNHSIEQVLRRRGGLFPSSTHYPMRPIMVTTNDYRLQLFNGDIGVEWQDDRGGIEAWFQMPDGTMRSFPSARLPAHETAWAMTIHKSQGSEFDRVLIVLPEYQREMLTRELIYTGITRAKQSVAIMAKEPSLKRAIEQRVQRASGLALRLFSDQD